MPKIVDKVEADFLLSTIAKGKLLTILTLSTRVRRCHGSQLYRAYV